MKCPKCNAELYDNATFCQACGEKINVKDTIYCPKCGQLTKANVSFCSKCGHKLPKAKGKTKITNRSPEFILGMIGSAIGLLIGLSLIFTGRHDLMLGGIYALTLSSIGLVTTLYLKTDKKTAGFVLVVVALIFLVNSRNNGIIESILFGIAGLMAIFKN